MTHVEFFKLQAKNLFRDYKTKTPVFDKVINDDLYEYSPTYFDIDNIVLEFDIDEDDFSLMKAQHTIAQMVGFRKWTDLAKATETELELAKLLFDNQDKVHIDDWNIYIEGAEDLNHKKFDAEARLAIFKEVVLKWDAADNPFSDYRLPRKTAA